VTGSVIRPTDTGVFVTTGQTGVFATAVNLAATGATLSAWTGMTNNIYLNLTGGYLTGPLSVGPSSIVSGLNNRSILSLTGIWSGSGAGANWTSFTGLSINITTTGMTGNYFGTNVYVNISEDNISRFQVDSASGVIFPNGNVSSLSFMVNPGSVTAFEMPITSGVGISGIEQSYSFNIGGTTVAKIYCESDNVSGIQNESFVINSALVLKPSGIAVGSSLATRPFYFFTGASVSTLILPPINMTTGRHYIIKNRGANITLTGKAGDLIFSTSAVASYPINSGDAISIINDGYVWCLV